MRQPRLVLLLILLALLPACLGPAPTVTPVPPTATAVPPTATLAPPTATLAPPTLTPLPPTATLQPPTPNPQPPALAWQQATTAHFTFYYLPGSQAERDLALIKATGEQAIGDVAAMLAVTPTAQIAVYLVNRIFWQGGASYSDNVLLLSYTDPQRDYVASDLQTVFRHEVTHALVEALVGTDNKGGMLGEGVAVWAAGGHYHPEPLDRLAATLTGDNMGFVIPLLPNLQTDFYGQQHEIAYLEGGALVQYLIGQYGVDRFKRLLANPMRPNPIYNKSWPELESEWLAFLMATPHTADDSEAVQLRVRYYDLMRQYEKDRDPDARTLPEHAPPVWDDALIRLFSQPSRDPANHLLEEQLTQAGRALWSRDLATTRHLLDQVEVALR